MEAFLMVVIAAAVLGVGLAALVLLLRLTRKMDPTDSQER